MIGSRRFLRALLAWIAIVAYVTPVAVHSMPRQHEHAIADSSEEPCANHRDGDSHAESGHVSTIAQVAQLKAAEAGDGCAGHHVGSAACCVAMCTPALPPLALVGMWTPELGVTSDRRIAAGVIASFVTRLDRPPKRIVASIG